MANRKQQSSSLLLSQLLWFIRLRFGAGAAAVLFGLLDTFWLHWYGHGLSILLTGLAILGYNILMLQAARQLADSMPRTRMAMAWAQILFDLACLTFLTTCTGGIASPLMGFYVFHMIFASLLLPRRMAYAGALISLGMVAAALALSGNWPGWSTGQAQLALGWATSLLVAVYLSNHITRALRRQRQRLLKQNRQIRKIGRKMRHQQETLISQEKMAAMGQMAAGITHEIANPLASMDSLLQLIQRKPEKANEQSIQSLRLQVSRINQIVRQMTAFAHPGGEHWEVQSINSVVETALEMVHFDKRMARVQLKKQLDPADSSARLMPHAMQQVMINLIGNALDAMEETPEPVLMIRTGRENGACVIQITDNGHGIRPEHLSRLFEPFFTTKPIGKGTGVGLSITYSLVRRQGGDIAVESRPGNGATFTVRVPAVAIE